MDWCCELPKINNLIEHYQEISAKGDTSFAHFLGDHYGIDKDQHHDEKDNHDSELPFQGSHSCCHILVFVDATSFASFSLEYPIPNITNDFYQSSFYSASLGAVFQPPQSA